MAANDTTSTDVQQEEVKTEDSKKTSTSVKLIKNIKYGNKVYKIGDTVKVKADDLEEFNKAGVIKSE